MNRKSLIIALALAFLAFPAKAQNYTATAGAGLTFGAKSVGSAPAVLYPYWIMCDATTITQCVNINSSGQVAIQAPPALPLPSGASTSVNQTSQITQETAIATGVGTPTDAVASLPASSSSASMIALLKALANVGQYPSGATAITASATGTTTSTTATLAGVASHTTYICSLSIRANATAAATGNATVTGTITGTLNYTQWTAPLASGVGVVEQIFNPCVPASAQNTGIAINSAAPGSGGVVSVSATGYQL